MKNTLFRRPILSAVAIAMTMMACSPKKPADTDKFVVQDKQFFSLTMPESFQVDFSMRADFLLYSIYKDDKPYVGIYVGNFPQFPTEDFHPDSVLDGEHLKIASTWEGNKLTGREILIRNNSGGFAGYIHAWIEPESPDIQLSDRILMSIKDQRKSPKETAKPEPVSQP